MPTTLPQKQAATIAELRKSTIELLSWSDEYLSHFMYETGLEYLHAYFKGDEDVIGFVILRREFWSWWKSQWALRDRVFNDDVFIAAITLKHRLAIYRELHNPEILATEIYPGRVVMGLDYATILKLSAC